MNKSFCICLLFLLTACSDPRENFLGTWNNGGTGNVVISKLGDDLLFELKDGKTGQKLISRGARIEDGYLSVDGDAIFKKVAYSEEKKGLLVLNNFEPLPVYHLVK
jgi:hypothetical protein